MEWWEALEIVAERTGHERYRWLTSDANPDVGSREGYRRLAVEIATGEPPPDPGPVPTPEDVALRSHVEGRGGCCGG